MKIAVAGASGFIGRALLQKLKGEGHQIVGLSRSHKSQAQTASQVEWRSCDLFNLLDSENALQGVEAAVYLVHSMRPSAHLSQGSFADFDLIVADNFVRAAKKNGVKHILFLGGLCPSEARMESLHLQSRHEVERIFVDSEIPYTVLRAALIVGPEGSSFHILTRLVERLPVMLCPSWSQTRSQPVALKDVVESISYCLQEPKTRNRIYDLGGEDILSYKDMMAEVAKRIGKDRTLIPVPLMTPRLSSLWVSLITGAPQGLVKPLVDGLKVNLVARPEARLEIPGYKFMNFSESIEMAFQGYSSRKKPHAFKKPEIGFHEVRSVQRLPLPKGWSSEAVARAYMGFLPRLHLGLVKVEVMDPWIYFSNRWPYVRLLVLEYSPDRSWINRQLFYVRGGLLSKKKSRGRLEFREILGGHACIAAIHDFRPRLPWPVYRYTQALIHVWVMRQFGRHLARRARREKIT